MAVAHGITVAASLEIWREECDSVSAAMSERHGMAKTAGSKLSEANKRHQAETEANGKPSMA